MVLGVITDSDIRGELLSRGITISVPGVTTPVAPVTPVSPVVTLPPPTEPQEPVTVSPRPPIDYYEPYIPYYPPAVVYPEDVEEEVFPYVTPGEPAKAGLSTGLVAFIGIVAFALVSLAKPKTAQRSRRPTRRREYYQEEVL